MLNAKTARAIAAAIRTVDEDGSALLSGLTADRSLIVSFVNAHAVNIACRQPDFCAALLRSEVLLRDGIGVKILMRTIGRRPGLNMNGTDLIPRVLAANRSRDIALYGSTATIAAAAAASLQHDGAQNVTHADGFQPTEYYLQRVRADRPRVVVLGMGMPKQELVARAIIEAADSPLLILNGGAILDFMSGRFQRAPTPLRGMGLEWLYRLMLEPRRLWRRYLLGNILFLARTSIVGLQRLPTGRTTSMS